MIVTVQNKVYDELSVLWTRGKNNGGDETGENTKSVGQVTNKKIGKSNEIRSVSQCGEMMVRDDECGASKEKATQALS
jgi:hypothetical protein